jgi:hypothetical protein
MSISLVNIYNFVALIHYTPKSRCSTDMSSKSSISDGGKMFISESFVI